jgi:hypothetical protein
VKTQPSDGGGGGGGGGGAGGGPAGGGEPTPTGPGDNPLLPVSLPPLPSSIDVIAPRIVLPAADRSLTVSVTGVLQFGVGPFEEDVSGSVAFTAGPGAGGRAAVAAARLRLGTKSFRAPRGRRVVVRVKLPRRALAQLRRRRRLTATAAITARDTAGNIARSSYRFSIRLRRGRGS